MCAFEKQRARKVAWTPAMLRNTSATISLLLYLPPRVPEWARMALLGELVKCAKCSIRGVGWVAMIELVLVMAKAHASHESHYDDDDWYYRDNGGAWFAFVFVFLLFSCMLCLMCWPGSYSYPEYETTRRCRECNAPLARGMVVCSACREREPHEPQESRESREARDQQLLLMGALLGASSCGPNAPSGPTGPTAPKAPNPVPSAPPGGPSGCPHSLGSVQLTDDDGHTSVFRKCGAALEMRSNARASNYPVYVHNVQRMTYKGHTLTVQGHNADGSTSANLAVTRERSTLLKELRTLSQQCNVTFEVVPNPIAPP